MYTKSIDSFSKYHGFLLTGSPRPASTLARCTVAQKSIISEKIKLKSGTTGNTRCFLIIYHRVNGVDLCLPLSTSRPARYQKPNIHHVILDMLSREVSRGPIAKLIVDIVFYCLRRFDNQDSSIGDRPILIYIMLFLSVNSFTF